MPVGASKRPENLQAKYGHETIIGVFEKLIPGALDDHVHVEGCECFQHCGIARKDHRKPWPLTLAVPKSLHKQEVKTKAEFKLLEY